MRKRILISFFLVISIILFSACGKKAESTSRAGNVGSAPQAAMDLKQSSEVAKSDQSSTDKSKASAPSEQKIIRNCDIYIVSDDLKKLAALIQSKSSEFGGYIENEGASEDNINTIVRVPSQKFDEFISFLEKSYDVKTKNINTQNITDVYIDNDSRLKNLKAQEEQILQILKKANTVEEVLKVQDELYKVRGEVEVLEGKKKSWDKLVDYSTVSVRASKTPMLIDNKNKVISGNDFVKAIGKGFTNTTTTIILVIQKIIIFFISNVLWIGAIAIIGFIGVKRYKKDTKNKNESDDL